MVPSPLQAAEKVNPNLNRTIVVLTKLDLSREAEVSGCPEHSSDGEELGPSQLRVAVRRWRYGALPKRRPRPLHSRLRTTSGGTYRT